MKDIWLISDTHFLQSNILSFRDEDGNLLRGAKFSSIEEMDETMVENWNSVVKKGDLVYHLGDVMTGPKPQFEKLWPRLNGSKRLVVGNHDDIPYLSKGGFFKKVQMWRIFRDHGLILTHVPIHESGFVYKGLINVNGHIHHHQSPTQHHFNVSVEAINFTPVHIDEIKSLHSSQLSI